MGQGIGTGLGTGLGQDVGAGMSLMPGSGPAVREASGGPRNFVNNGSGGSNSPQMFTSDGNVSTGATNKDSSIFGDNANASSENTSSSPEKCCVS